MRSRCRRAAKLIRVMPMMTMPSNFAHAPMAGIRVRKAENGGDALRFEKRLVPNLRALAVVPPYFHQTTQFTCGPACIMMAQGRDLDAAAQAVHRAVRAVAARREWSLHD